MATTKKYNVIRKDAANILNYLANGKVGFFGRSTKKTMAIIDKIASEGADKAFIMERWNLDESQMDLIDPIIFTTIYDGPYQKSKKDNVIRAYSYCTYALGFTEKEVHIFKKVWNVVDFDVVIITNEFFYDDVTSMTIVDKDLNDYYKTTTGRFKRSKGEYINERKQQMTFTIYNEEYVTPVFSNKDPFFDSLQGAISLIRERKGRV